MKGNRKLRFHTEKLTNTLKGKKPDTGITMKEIRQQIKEHQFHKVYLLTGDEDYLLTQAKNLLKQALVKEGDISWATGTARHKAAQTLVTEETEA